MSRVTITSGKFRGRQLVAPDTSATHPMGSREKLALFNALTSLGADFSDDTSVLDIYAGSGALGLEAASRGAKDLVFVEKHPQALAAIRENLRSLHLDSAEVLKSLPDTPAFSGRFDLILADPPYVHFPVELAFLSAYLKSGGLLALSHPASVQPADLFSDLTLLSTKSYAASRISFFRKH